VQLQQSPYLNIVPEQRVRETLQLMGLILQALAWSEFWGSTSLTSIDTHFMIVVSYGS
jgi:hypothetical protein